MGAELGRPTRVPIGSFAFVFVLLPSLLPAAGASSLHGSAWPLSASSSSSISLANLVLVLPASFPHCHLHQTIISRSSIITAILASYLPRFGSPALSSTLINQSARPQASLAFPLGNIRVTVAGFTSPFHFDLQSRPTFTPSPSTSGLFTSSSSSLHLQPLLPSIFSSFFL